MEFEGFRTFVRNIASADTSSDPAGWTLENPLWGHCAIVALLAQDMYGGELIRGPLSSIPRYSALRSHYWNKIEGVEIDFTSEQFPDISFRDLRREVRTRDSVLDHPDTIRRYKLLKSRFDKD